MFELTEGGPALGVVSGAEYRETTVRLDPADTVVMFTDGVTEAHVEANYLFQKSGIMNWLSKQGRISADEMAAGLLEAATQHAGGTLKDDAAILVLRMIGRENSGGG